MGSMLKPSLSFLLCGCMWMRVDVCGCVWMCVLHEHATLGPTDNALSSQAVEAAPAQRPEQWSPLCPAGLVLRGKRFLPFRERRRDCSRTKSAMTPFHRVKLNNRGNRNGVGEPKAETHGRSEGHHLVIVHVWAHPGTPPPSPTPALPPLSLDPSMVRFGRANGAAFQEPRAVIILHVTHTFEGT